MLVKVFINMMGSNSTNALAWIGCTVCHSGTVTVWMRSGNSIVPGCAAWTRVAPLLSEQPNLGAPRCRHAWPNGSLLTFGISETSFAYFLPQYVRYISETSCGGPKLFLIYKFSLSRSEFQRLFNMFLLLDMIILCRNQEIVLNCNSVLSLQYRRIMSLCPIFLVSEERIVYLLDYGCFMTIMIAMLFGRMYLCWT